jgi:signal transduction histidine kinase
VVTAETRNGVSFEILEGLATQLGVGIVLCDPADNVIQINERLTQDFPSVFVVGKRFGALLDQVSTVEKAGTDRSVLERTAAPGEVRRLDRGGSPPAFYRHIHFRLGSDAAPLQVHCLVDITKEKNLEETFLTNLTQLTSMKEIVDILYESLSTQEVIYMILVAVTSQLGFGFNRAFYLEVRGDRLRGKIGIGPSSIEDAHRIWGRLASLNLPTLRALYQDLTRNGKPPDPQTQETAAAMDFPLHSPASALLGAIERGKPSLITSAQAGSQVDAKLFDLLRTDAVAAVPLYVRQSLAGMLIADNFITRKPITDHDLNVLKTFSGYAGVALERSQLYDELRQSVAKLQAANEVLKSHQLKLLQAEKLSAIGELAACVSHEIRNPLVAIGGLARSLLKDESIGAEHQESLQLIASEVARLEKFLRETLDFVKPEVMGTKPMDIRLEVEGCLVPFRKELEEQSIEIERGLGDDPLICPIDPDLLRRALSNLIKNSIESAGKGGRIHLACSRNGYSAEIEVADSGPGIPPELHSRAFEPFFTTKPEGTGLGLAIALQSIRSLGGQISLQAGERFKTIFKIILPLEEAQARSIRGEGIEVDRERIEDEDRARG